LHVKSQCHVDHPTKCPGGGASGPWLLKDLGNSVILHREQARPYSRLIESRSLSLFSSSLFTPPRFTPHSNTITCASGTSPIVATLCSSHLPEPIPYPPQSLQPQHLPGFFRRFNNTRFSATSVPLIHNGIARSQVGWPDGGRDRCRRRPRPCICRLLW